MLDGFKSDVLYLYSKFNLEIFIMKITNPKLEVVRFNADDVIATSVYWMTAADYEAATGNQVDTPYVTFNGNMTNNYDPSTCSWEINITTPVDPMEDFGWIEGIPEIHYPGRPYAYEAYYNNGTPYTKGVTYAESKGQ